MSEDQLIEGLRLQRRIAYEQAYYIYRDVVFRAISKKVKVVEDAEELLQNVFVKVFKKIDQFDGRSQFKTWLIRIAINTSLNFLESIKTQHAVKMKLLDKSEQKEEDDDETVSLLPTPEELVLQKEGRAMLLKAFTQLPANQHTACKLFYIEGLRQLEIAEIMAMSLDAVQSLIQRGKTTLRSILKNIQLTNIV